MDDVQEAGHELIRTNPEEAVLVLRPGTLPADPGDEQDGPADPTPAGDPDEAVRLFREYLRLRTEILGQEEEELPAPLDPARRAELAAACRVALPADLLALYGEADGEFDGIFHNHPWFDLESTVQGPGYDYDIPGWSGNPVWGQRFDAVPPGRVRRSRSRPGWIPFATSEGGAFLAVDMDPGPAGRPGQVIAVGIDLVGPVYVADSVTAMLRRHVEALRRGDYELDEGYLDVGAQWPDRWNLEEKLGWDAGDHGESLREMPSTVQYLTSYQAAGLDLEPARRAPLLRSVTLAGPGPVDLHPLCDAPLETAHLFLDHNDLSPLAGHPTLRALRLGSRNPVDLGVLRTLPRLHGLDLSRAVVHDIETLLDLDRLLFLSLRHEQWLQLWEHGTLPWLAAAGLGGTPSPADAEEWAARFR
ncbi:SMI1/KNR4 family protein [Actinomadura alba]|uniref:SMI1/KNR4 family protein n=1 Tax=Actinomadura alba TaxID=406431 RepID=A0ABR7M3A9_9ACTN|nr:SMI1/KNR4 family protein [Actinomadura alba]MBC6471220.1 SMI1/KNR4 family protein [Actinomadura alba]